MGAKRMALKPVAKLRTLAALILAVAASWTLFWPDIALAAGRRVDMSDYAYVGGDYQGIDLAAKSVFYVEVYGADYKMMGSGSGFVMFDERLFVTNQHVIQDASYLLIVDDDGRQYVLDQVAVSDQEHDIAILLFPEGKYYQPLPYDTNFEQLIKRLSCFGDRQSAGSARYRVGRDHQRVSKVSGGGHAVYPDHRADFPRQQRRLSAE